MPEILDQTDRVGAKSTFSIYFRSYSDWAVTPSEKSSINTNSTSTGGRQK